MRERIRQYIANKLVEIAIARKEEMQDAIIRYRIKNRFRDDEVALKGIGAQIANSPTINALYLDLERVLAQLPLCDKIANDMSVDLSKIRKNNNSTI